MLTIQKLAGEEISLMSKSYQKVLVLIKGHPMFLIIGIYTNKLEP